MTQIGAGLSQCSHRFRHIQRDYKHFKLHLYQRVNRVFNKESFLKMLRYTDYLSLPNTIDLFSTHLTTNSKMQRCKNIC